MCKTPWLTAALLGLGVLGVPGCGENPGDEMGMEEAIHTVCESPKWAVVDDETVKDPSEKVAACSRWIAAHVTNKEATQWFSELAPLPPEAKAATVRDAASRVGLNRCPLADLWTQR